MNAPLICYAARCGYFDAPRRVKYCPKHSDRARSYTVQRVRLNSGGYESDGTYWGLDAPLWRAVDRESGDFLAYLRASDRHVALARFAFCESESQRIGVRMETIAKAGKFPE